MQLQHESPQHLDSFFSIYPDPKTLSGAQALTHLPEFTDYITHKRQSKPGEIIPLHHQIIIRRLMSGYNTIDSLLLIHEMGTGKTCTAIYCIEQLFADNQGLFGLGIGPGCDKALILVKNKSLVLNFKEELSKCGLGQHNHLYQFMTFDIFAKKMQTLTDSRIVSQYENTFIVIDEVHNLNNLEEGYIYIQIHRFIHLLQRKKVLLLTGTPIRDKPEEIANLLNLILPADHQMPIGDEFNNTFFANTKQYRQMKNVQRFKSYINPSKAGGDNPYVSYLETNIGDIPKIDMGEHLDLKYLKVVPHRMSEFQTAAYQQALRSDAKELGIYVNSRQASRFVFPDGSYGSAGFNKHVANKNGVFRMKPNFLQVFAGKSTDQKLALIDTYSAKYGYIIRALLAAKAAGENSIVYDDSVRGSGLVVFSLLLSQFGFVRNFGTKKTKDSYCILSSETTTPDQINTLKNIFNSADNIHGEIISVVLGSRVISEGLTFRNVIHEHVVPHWNNSETAQVISRGWRVGSHADLQREGIHPVLRVYRHAVIPAADVRSLDLEMYRLSEQKNFEIIQIIRCLQEIAIDCNLFTDRNTCLLDGISTSCAVKCDIPSAATVATKYVQMSNNFMVYNDHQTFVLNIIQLHFRLSSAVLVKQIIGTVQEHYGIEINLAEIMYYIIDIIYRKIIIYNKYSYPCYLYCFEDMLYILEYAAASDLFHLNLAYYTDHPQLFEYAKNQKHIDRFNNYSLLLNNRLISYIPEMFSKICENKKHLRTFAMQLPHDVQQMMLEYTISAEIIYASQPKYSQPSLKNKASIRSTILDIYKNYYKIFRPPTDKLAIAWFISDVAKKPARCLYAYNTKRTNMLPLWLRWKPCKKADKSQAKVQPASIHSPYGYVGTWNPTSDDFCIKNTCTPKNQDKRKLLMGKRCINWTKQDLVKLMALVFNVSPLEPDFDARRYVSEMKAKPNMRAMISRLNAAQTVRVAYWYSKTREFICSYMRRWLDDNKLMIPDYNCGVQEKRK